MNRYIQIITLLKKKIDARHIRISNSFKLREPTKKLHIRISIKVQFNHRRLHSALCELVYHDVQLILRGQLTHLSIIFFNPSYPNQPLIGTLFGEIIESVTSSVFSSYFHKIQSDSQHTFSIWNQSKLLNIQHV